MFGFCSCKAFGSAWVFQSILRGNMSAGPVDHIRSMHLCRSTLGFPSVFKMFMCSPMAAAYACADSIDRTCLGTDMHVVLLTLRLFYLRHYSEGQGTGEKDEYWGQLGLFCSG